MIKDRERDFVNVALKNKSKKFNLERLGKIGLQKTFLQIKKRIECTSKCTVRNLIRRLRVGNKQTQLLPLHFFK